MSFKGLGTALITPFKNGGDIDFKSMEKLINFQIDSGVDYLMIAGTTGEGVTLSDEELYELLKFSKEKVQGRVPVVAGCGGNNTRVVVERIKYLNELKLAGYLVVTPFYNKPTQDGVFKHYSEVAKAAGGIPIIVYNVPGRTGGWIMPETVRDLAVKFKNIVAIKEASGDVCFAMDMYRKVKRDAPDFTFLSGDDALTFALISVGYSGVISVVSNEVPKLMKELVDSAVKGNVENARMLNYKLLDLMKTNFIETNPGPVKYAMKRLGFGDGSVRLPLSELKNKGKMDEVLKGYLM